tara:strand:+ start:193 stop:393 length:201 start_codon:yes stop_codon:yes gene_type:complete
MSDNLINGIPFEKKAGEKGGVVITLRVSKYVTQEQVDNAIKETQFQYINKNLRKIVVKQHTGETFA